MVVYGVITRPPNPLKDHENLHNNVGIKIKLKLDAINKNDIFDDFNTFFAGASI